MESKKVDLAVIGCGIAGCMAAISAARKGCAVLAIDEAGYPGGALTAMGTGPMMTFHAGKTQVVRGLPQEMVKRMVERGFSPGHTVDSTGYTYTVTPFSSEGMKRILEEMMTEAGVTVLYHTTVYQAEVEDGMLKAVSCFSCGENFTVSASVFIDATGDGDLLALSGVPFTKGRSSDGKTQPMTMNFKIAGVDTDRIRTYMERSPELFPFLRKKPGIEKYAARLSVCISPLCVSPGSRKCTCESMIPGSTIHPVASTTTSKESVLCDVLIPPVTIFFIRSSSTMMSPLWRVPSLTMMPPCISVVIPAVAA